MIKLGVAAALALATLTLLAPGAIAGGSFDGGVFVIHVKDAFESNCSVTVAGFCFFTIQTNESVGDSFVNVYQRVEYVGIATDLSPVNDLTGSYLLLPDSSMVVNGSSLFLDHSAFRLVSETWNDLPLPPEAERVELTPDHASVTHPYPSWEESGSFRDFESGIAYGETIGYERVGPGNRLGGNTTDGYHAQTYSGLCQPRGEQRCAPAVASTMDAIPVMAPNIAVGLEFEDIEMATDPSALTFHGALKGKTYNETVAGANPGSLPVPEAETLAPGLSLTQSRRGGIGPSGRIPNPAIPDPAAPAPLQVMGEVPEAQAPLDMRPLILVTLATAATLLLAALGAALYSRFNSRDEALKSELRQRLLSIVRESPGISLAELTERMGLARSTVTHHLRVLERVHLVRVVEDGKLRLFYATGTQVVKAPAWLRRNPVCLAILAMLDAAPEGLTRDAVQERLPDVPERTRNYHLKRLVDVGALVQESSPDGRKVFRKAEGWTSGAGSSSSGTA